MPYPRQVGRAQRPPVGQAVTANRASPQARGLVAWWPTLPSFGGGQLADYSQGLRPGTLTGGATWAADPEMGVVLVLDGTDDYVDCGTVEGGLGTSGSDAPYSLALWVNPSALRNDGMWLSYGAAAPNEVLSLGTNGSAYYVVHYGNDHAFTTTVTTNAWSHVALTYDPSTSTETLYVNGLSRETWTPSDLFITTPRTLWLGRATWNSVYAAACKLADVRLYNRPLTAGEVWGLYAPQTRWQLYAPTPSMVLKPPPRVVTVALGGALSSSGALGKQGQKRVAGSVGSSGSLAKQARKSLAGALSATGVLVKQASRWLGGSLGTLGTLGKRVSRSLIGALGSAGAMAFQGQKRVAGVLAPTGSLLRRVSVALGGALGVTGALTKSMRRALSGMLSLAGGVTARLSGALRPAAHHVFWVTVEERVFDAPDETRVFGVDPEQRSFDA